MALHFDITGDLLIGEESFGNDRSFRAIDPATGAALEPAFAIATEADVQRACRLAGEAFDAFRSISLEADALDVVGLAFRTDRKAADKILKGLKLLR